MGRPPPLGPCLHTRASPLNSDSFDKTLVARVETLVERDALEKLLEHRLLADLPRVEGYPVLGTYVLFAQLGSGGMANVFRGLHVRLENEVAIKIRTAPAGQAGARFQREATVAAKLEHQNLVRATDVDEIGGLQYMVLDYIDGEDAAERVERKGPLDAREALTILRDSALGLGEAHRLDFVHRDIKPANIMISRDGRVKLADLGLAKSVVDDDLGLTAAGGILGTPMYMAPEQFRSSEETCKASDVYGLGASGCFLLTGRHPFDGRSVPEIMQQVCMTGMARLDVSLPSLDVRVVDLIAGIVAMDVGDRPADGAELARQIASVLDAIGGPVDLSDPDAGASKARGVMPPTVEARSRMKAAITSTGSPGRSDTVVAKPSGGAKHPAASEPSSASEEETRSKLPWLAAAMLLTAGGGVAWSLLGKGDTEGTSPERQVRTPQTVMTHQGDPGESTDTPTTRLTVDAETKPATEMSAAPEVEAEADALDLDAIDGFVRNASAGQAWSAGYAGLLGYAEDAKDGGRIAELAKFIEAHSMNLRKERRYETTSELLNQEGQDAVTQLARRDELFVPWTAITAAELIVEFNGIDYEVDLPRRKLAEDLLRKAQVGGDPQAAAQAQLLLGVVYLDDCMDPDSAHLEDDAGERAHDLFIEAAVAAPDSEAAAWLGVLYLYSIERSGPDREAPVWFETQRMLELLKSSLAAGTKSADAAFVMGHICSDGLAGEPKSLENARGYYEKGAQRGNVGCISEAILYGGSLEGKLRKETEEKLIYFAESLNEKVKVYVRDAYALAAFTSSFRGASEDASSRLLKGIEFLQSNVDLRLAQGLTRDRDMDRLAILLATMLRASADGGELAREDALEWVSSRKDDLAKEIYSGGVLSRALPAWTVLFALDPELAREIMIAGADPNQHESIRMTDVNGLGKDFANSVQPEDYAEAPYLWSSIGPALEMVNGR
ncbi:MAG: serine/threonine protein kinase [Planctomycetota bacterium]|jgi:serine/threonine protein kinase